MTDTIEIHPWNEAPLNASFHECRRPLWQEIEAFRQQYGYEPTVYQHKLGFMCLLLPEAK